jgi:hypothetical protein
LVEPSDIVRVAATGSESTARRLTASRLNARLLGVGGEVDSLPQDRVPRIAAATTRKREENRTCVWSGGPTNLLES